VNLTALSSFTWLICVPHLNIFFSTVLERPASQVSFFAEFLKESKRSGELSNSRRLDEDAEDGDTDDDDDDEEGMVDDACDDAPSPSLPSSSPRSNLSPSDPPSNTAGVPHHPLAAATFSSPGAVAGGGGQGHQFLVRSFSAPLKCSHCTSLLLGLARQGLVCESCGFACHMHCKPRVPPICPVPPDQSESIKRRQVLLCSLVFSLSFFPRFLFFRTFLLCLFSLCPRYICFPFAFCCLSLPSCNPFLPFL
jgi:hypothetical protein